MKFSIKNLPEIFITTGDPNSIGPEIVLKSIQKKDYSKILIFGSKNIFNFLKKEFKIDHIFHFIQSLSNFDHTKLNIFEIAEDKFKVSLGSKTIDGAKLSLQYLDTAISVLKQYLNLSPILITGPICKETISNLEKDFTGHTNYLKKKLDSLNVTMLMFHNKIKVTLCTQHIPLKEVSSSLLEENIIYTSSLSIEFLKKLYKKENLVIGICGLNPHAGENGYLGEEEEKVIKPAISKLKKLFPLCSFVGPLSPDSAFFYYKNYNLFVTHYHDQGLIPFKLLTFQTGINITLGLPIIRLSVDHGTAFSIAKQNIANPTSMKNAIKLAFFLKNL